LKKFTILDNPEEITESSATLFTLNNSGVFDSNPHTMGLPAGFELQGLRFGSMLV
jgi:hypothetical protein